MVNKKFFLFAAAALFSSAALISCNKTAGTGAVEDADSGPVKRGEYIVKITGCNDCHTPGYPESDATLPVDEWLTGSPLGWKGPWGTTYALNLRLFVQGLTEAEWIDNARNVKARPPMPWYVLRDMSDTDLTDVYLFIKSLGPAGEPTPAYVPPDKEPTGPYVEFPATP